MPLVTQIPDGIHDGINVVFMPADTTSVLHPVGQAVTLTSKFYYSKNVLHKLIAARVNV
jgi:hypothetical protein